MNTSKNKMETIDEYIQSCPEEVRTKLQIMRETIRKEAPEAEETISYRMPTFRLHGNLVHFAVMKNHIGLYPTSSGVTAFKKDLTAYETSPGAIRFPLDKPLPLPLIRKIVRFRVKENKERANSRAMKAEPRKK